MTKDQKIAELEKRIKDLEDAGRYWPGYTPPVDGPFWYRSPTVTPPHWSTTICGTAFSCLQ